MRKAIKKKTFTNPLYGVRRVYNQIIDYMKANNTSRVTICNNNNDDTLYYIREFVVDKKDLETTRVQTFLCRLADEWGQK